MNGVTDPLDYLKTVLESGESHPTTHFDEFMFRLDGVLFIPIFVAVATYESLDNLANRKGFGPCDKSFLEWTTDYFNCFVKSSFEAARKRDWGVYREAKAVYFGLKSI